MKSWTETCLLLARLREAVGVRDYMRTMARLKGWTSFSYSETPLLVIKARRRRVREPRGTA